MIATFLPFALQCAMCYSTASQQGAKAMAAMNAGILILLLPPMAIIGGLSWLTYTRRGSDSVNDPPVIPY